MVSFLKLSSRAQETPLNKKQTIQFFSYIAKVLRVGYSLEKAIESWNCPKDKQKQCKRVLEGIRRGMAFSEALKVTKLVDPVYYGVIEAAEVVGNLGPTLEDLQRELKKYLKMEEEIKKPLIMPIVEMILGFVVFNGVFLYVIPKMSESLSSLGAQLPDISKAIFAFAKAFYDSKMFIFLGYALIPLFFYVTREKWAAKLFLLPVIGEIKRYYFTQRFMQQLGIFLRGGVSLSNAVERIKNAVKSNTEKAYLSAVLVGLSKGVPFDLALTLSSLKLIPEEVLPIIRVTRQTGSYVEVLDEVRDMCAEVIMDRLSKIGTIVMLVVVFLLALVVLLMVFSVYYPLFSMDLSAMRK